MWRLLCPHCSWAVAGQVEGWIDKAHSPVEKARSNSWKRLQENTHTPRGTDKVLATCTPSLISFVTFFSWHWVGSQGNWGTDHTSYSLSTEKEGWGCLIMRKGKIGQYSFLSRWMMWRKSFCLGKSEWKRVERNEARDTPFSFSAFNLRRVSQIWKRE